MNNFLQSIKDFFAKEPCRACVARDYITAILRDELHRKDEHIAALEARIDNLIIEYTSDISKRLDFATGAARAAQVRETSVLHSIPHKGGIQQRIVYAEAADKKEAAQITAERRRAYDARIAEIKPEVEVLDNASNKR